jgi:predicted anti-sigma-YlaC factor YlaD
MRDYGVVECEHCREALSAQLDGEDEPAERVAVDAHLAGCAACRQWLDAAAAITRLARTAVVTGDVQISEKVLAAVPGRGRARVTLALRTLLGVLGAVQFVLGVAQIGGFATGHLPAGLTGAGTDHLWHEAAAWNAAVGAGFGWIALQRSRPNGLVPTLTAFVASRVDFARVFSHGFVLVGYVIILVLTRSAADFTGPSPGRRGTRSKWRAHFDDDGDKPAAVPPLPWPLRGLPMRGHAHHKDVA